jgi:error-prone DNA polymerase
MSWDDAIDGVDRETPGDRMPRALQVVSRLRHAANDDHLDDDAPAYAELHCLSDFSFLRGAASAEELFDRARHCGYRALAVTDECSLAGIVRALEASLATGVRLIVGSEFRLVEGTRFVVLVENALGYTRLCELITRGRRAADKGTYRLDRAAVDACCGCRRRRRVSRPMRNPATGCVPRSASALSSPWNCTASRTTTCACRLCARWRVRCA